MAQLAWTLRQVPGIERHAGHRRRHTRGLPHGCVRRGRSRGGPSYDPAVPTAGAELYALRAGTVVVLGEQETLASDGVPVRPRLRSIAVSLGSSTDDVAVAGVTADGRQVVSSVLPTLAGTGERRPDGSTGHRRPAPGVRHLRARLARRPRRSGARLVVIDGGRTRDAPASGHHRRGRDRAAHSRGTAPGSPRSSTGGSSWRASAATEMGRRRSASSLRSPYPLEQQVRRAARSDLAWTTPASLGVLVRLGPTISQIVFASVDGSLALNSEATAPRAALRARRPRRHRTGPADAPVLPRAVTVRADLPGLRDRPWAPVPASRRCTRARVPGLVLHSHRRRSLGRGAVRGWGRLDR